MHGTDMERPAFLMQRQGLNLHCKAAGKRKFTIRAGTEGEVSCHCRMGMSAKRLHQTWCARKRGSQHSIMRA